MATSQEFQKHLSSGNLAEAMKLALSEMIELRISTRVVSEDGSADDRPGHQINTRINIVDGDIENEIGSLFLKNGPYSELRSFHAQQVADAQQIIRTNIESLQTLIGLLLQGLNRPSGQESVTESVTESIVVSSESPDATKLGGFGSLGSAFGTMAVGAAAVGTAAAGAAAAGAFTTGTAVGVTTVGVGQFDATESISPDFGAPVAFTEEATEPEAFSAVLDGAGEWSEPEGLDFAGEPLGDLTETLSVSPESFGSVSESEPLAALDLGAVAPDATMEEITEEAIDLGLTSTETPEDLGLSMDRDSFEEPEDSFDLAFEKASVDEPLASASEGWEEEESLPLVGLALDDNLSLDRDEEELDFTATVPDTSDSFLGFESEAESEAEELAAFELADMTSEEETPFGEDLGFETLQPTDEFALDSEIEESLESVSHSAELPSGVTLTLPELEEPTLEGTAESPLEAVDNILESTAESDLGDFPSFSEVEDDNAEDDEFILPNFEEPMAGFDIPDDLPDPLADLSFTNFAATSQPNFGNNEALELMGEEDQDLEDPAIWNLAEEQESGTETVLELGTEMPRDRAEDDTPEMEPLSTDASSDWTFETSEPSPNFSLEGTGEVDLDEEALEEGGLDESGFDGIALEPMNFSGGELLGDSFAGLEEEPIGELPDPFADSFAGSTEEADFEDMDFEESSFEESSFEEAGFEILNSGDDFGDESLDPLSESEAFSESEGFPSIASREEEPADLVMEDLGMEDPLAEFEDVSMEDGDLEDSFSDRFGEGSTDDFGLDAGDSLEDLASMTEVPEPQTFEEWEGIVPPGGGSLPSPVATSVPEDFSGGFEDDFEDDFDDAFGDDRSRNPSGDSSSDDLIGDLGDLGGSFRSLDEIDSGEWTLDESPSLSTGLADLDDWDDSDDLDDMALSPEEMGTSHPVHFDREEPLVGDAMGIADLDAMDSLFQNSDDDFDEPGSTGLGELDPFLDLDDPFDEVEEEDDPFASLDEDAPLFPPPPPRPR